MKLKAFLIAILFACSFQLLRAQDLAKRLVVVDNIPYRTRASKAWRLDMAMLESSGNELRPAIVIIHGGGWSGGSKQDRPFRSMLLDYAMKGYVTISIDYRLTGEASFPACIEDVKCAVRWLKAHAAQYKIDPDRIGAYGHSAGAHLAVMLALAPASAGLEGDGGWDKYSSTIKSAVGASTPTTRPDARFAPLTYIKPDMPPILLIHGAADHTVAVASADDFVDKAKKAGAKDFTYLRLDGGEHGVAYDSFLNTTSKAIADFFDRTLK